MAIGIILQNLGENMDRKIKPKKRQKKLKKRIKKHNKKADGTTSSGRSPRSAQDIVSTIWFP